MGCIFPKPLKLPTEENPNVFKVVNIDQDGNDHAAGEIEIDFEFLRLHANQKHQPFEWPLRSLRRYGYDNKIFSFEVGRKCTTGEGIFAFRCDQAEQLFRSLQNNIQRGSNNTNLIQNGVESNSAESRSTNPQNCRHESVGSWNSCPHTPASPTKPQNDTYNFDLATIDRRMLELKDSSNEDGSSNPVYINVIPNSEEIREPSTSKSNYVYFHDRKTGTPSLLIIPCKSEKIIGDSKLSRGLQYTQLDFAAKTSSPVVKTPAEEKAPSQYTVIDIHRTWALSQSTKPSVKNDIDCTRRTRHNPTSYGTSK